MKKLYLEFVRGAAAIVVLIYHAVLLQPSGKGASHLSYWGTDAVIIFFILSGIVINLSQTRNPKSKKAFLVNRILRLYPLFIVGLLMGLIVLFITGSAIPSFRVVLGNLFMVSTIKQNMGYIVPTINSNQPIWSLSFEMFFYLLFMLTIGRNQKKLTFLWLFIAFAVLPVYYYKMQLNILGHIITIVAFSTIWLLGYYIYEYRNYFYVSKYVALFSLGALPIMSRMHISSLYYDPLKYLLFALFAVPFFRYCLQIPQKGQKIGIGYLLVPHFFIVCLAVDQHYLPLSNAIAYGTLPYVLIGLCFIIDLLKLKIPFIIFINNAAKIIGKYSYALYISHFPVLFLCAALFHTAILYLLVSITCIVCITYSLETWLQPAITRFFKKKQQPVLTEALV